MPGADKEVFLYNINFWRNNALNPHDMRQHYRGDLSYLASKIYILKCFAVS